MTQKRAPKNKLYIAGFCSDSFKYIPSLKTVFRCRKAKITGYRKLSTAQRHCDILNSL